jgi:hypothetical protein
MSRFTVTPDQIRDALETLALDPRALGAPDVVLPTVRRLVDAARATVAANTPVDTDQLAARTAELRVFDAAAGGLFQFARSAIEGDTSLMTAPLAIVGTGALGTPGHTSGGRDSVLFVLGKRASTRMRGTAVARFVANGLGELGFDIGVTIMPLATATDHAGHDARFAATLRTSRFIDGRYDLYQRLPGAPAAAGTEAA